MNSFVMNYKNNRLNRQGSPDESKINSRSCLFHHYVLKVSLERDGSSSIETGRLGVLSCVVDCVHLSFTRHVVRDKDLTTRVLTRIGIGPMTPHSFGNLQSPGLSWDIINHQHDAHMLRSETDIRWCILVRCKTCAPRMFVVDFLFEQVGLLSKQLADNLQQRAGS